MPLGYTGTEVGLIPGDFVLNGDQLPPKGAQPCNFWPMSIAAKRSPMSATAGLLLLLPHASKILFSADCDKFLPHAVSCIRFGFWMTSAMFCIFCFANVNVNVNVSSRLI